MPDVLIRNIDVKVLDRLKEKAKRNKRSLQEELKQLLETYSGVKNEHVVKMVREIQEEYRSTEKLFPDSSEDISRDRQR
ncbi:hypothetical protein BH23BAC3_BH23BAC3_11200 [soil metagenome]